MKETGESRLTKNKTVILLLIFMIMNSGKTMRS